MTRMRTRTQAFLRRLPWQWALTIFMLAAIIGVLATPTLGQSSMSQPGGGSGVAVVTTTFSTAAAADYRPIVQYGATSTLGTALLDYSGNGKNANYTAGVGCSGSANPAASAAQGLAFTGSSAECLVLPALPTSLAFEAWVTIADPSPFNNGQDFGVGNACILGGAALANSVFLCTSSGSNNTSTGLGRNDSEFLSGVFTTGSSSNTDGAPIGTGIMIAYVPGAVDAFYINGQLVTASQATTMGAGLTSFVAMMTAGATVGGCVTWNQTTCWTGTLHILRFPTVAATQQQIQADMATGNFILSQAGIISGVGQSTSTTNFLLFGIDSLTALGNLANPWTSELALYNGPWKVDNHGMPAELLQQAITDFPISQAPFFHPRAGTNIFGLWGCTNDFKTATLTPYSCFQSIISGCVQAKRLGALAFVSTEVSGNNIPDVTRNQLNAMIRNGARAYCDDVIDFSNANVMANGACSNLTFFQSDCTHFSDFGSRSIIAPTVSAHINYKVNNLTSSILGNPHVIESGSATIPLIVQANVCYPANGSGGSCQFNWPVSVGSTLCTASWAGSGSAFTTSGVTDTLGGTWTAVTASVSFAGTANATWRPFCTPNSTGDTGITQDIVTTAITGASELGMIIWEIYGAASAAEIDVTATSNSGTSATPNSSSITTTIANDLVMMVVGTSSASGGGGINGNASYVTLPGPQGYSLNSNAIMGIGPNPLNPTHLAVESLLAPIAGVQTAGNGSGGGMTLSRATGTWAETFFGVKPGIFGTTVSMLPIDCMPASNPLQLYSFGGAFQLNMIDATLLTGETCSFLNIGAAGSAAVTLAATSGLSQTLNPNGITSMIIPPTKEVITCTSTLVSATAGGANWVCGIPQPYTITITAAYSNSTIGFTNLAGSSGPNLAFPLAVNTAYHLSCSLTYQAAASGGLNIEFTGPAGFTQLNYTLTENIVAGGSTTSATANAYSTSQGNVVTTAATNFPATIALDVINGATAGTLQLLGKSSAAVALTVQPGSSCTLTQQR